jgi:hypothetical protein
MSVTCGHCSTRETKVKHSTSAEVLACSQRPRTLGNLASGQQELRTQPADTTVRPVIHPHAAQKAAERATTITVAQGVLHQGYFTVVFAEDDRITLRVRRQRPDARFRPGDMLVSYLNGSNNEDDYVKFAGVEETKQGTCLKVWKRFADTERLAEALKVLAGDPQAAAKAFAVESDHCSKCNTLLTVPQGPDNPYRDAGYGPKCGADIFG